MRFLKHFFGRRRACGNEPCPNGSEPKAPTNDILPRVLYTAALPSIPKDLPGDAVWNQAIASCQDRRYFDARAHFVRAIQSNPAKFCGIGKGSWRPATSDATAVWLEAMVEVGLSDVATALAAPADLSTLTLSDLMSADDRLEKLLLHSCAKAGIAVLQYAETENQSQEVPTVTPQSTPGVESNVGGRESDGPTLIEQILNDRDSWMDVLYDDRKERLQRLSLDGRQIVLQRMRVVLTSEPEYWQFCICETLISEWLRGDASPIKEEVRVFSTHPNAQFHAIAARALRAIESC